MPRLCNRTAHDGQVSRTDVDIDRFMAHRNARENLGLIGVTSALSVGTLMIVGTESSPVGNFTILVVLLVGGLLIWSSIQHPRRRRRGGN